MDQAESPEPNWKLAAACRSREDKYIFFPTSKNEATTPFAKSICKRCPVKTQCFIYAWTEQIDDGIFGGTDEWQRREMKALFGPNLPTHMSTGT